MKKKSLITMLVALSVTASVMVGATLAYLTAETGEVKNTFTIGNVNIKLEEPSWEPDDALNLEPGAVIAKDPTVTNTGVNEAFVAVTVSGMDEMASVGFSATVNNGWVKVNADGSADTVWAAKAEKPLEDGIYAYTAVLPAVDDPATTGVNEKETPALFSNVTYNGLSSTTTYTIVGVPVDENDISKGEYYVIKDANQTVLTKNGVALQFATAVEAKNYIDSNVNTLGNVQDTSFDLVVKAYAIQTTGFETATNYAWIAEIDF